MAFNKLIGRFTGKNDEEEEEYEEEEEQGTGLSGYVKKDNTMILLEPRAYSESQQIADYLKANSSVVVNLRRVTPDQAKRIVDFLSGTIYAIGGDLQKLGGGIFLLTPSSVNVEGKITDEGLKGKDAKAAKNSKTTEDKEDDEEYNW